MCDTPAEYKPGDIVWVKLAGICWWPGETADYEQLEEAVKDDLKISLKQRSPIAIVKFFQEDSYEYVNKHDKIFPYNCSKKDDFIRKGMDMHRAKKNHMENFPDDVVIAEQRIGGNENILDDPKFTRPKVDTSILKMFGTPEVKPSPKPGGRHKGLGSKSPRFVTHPRFTGKLNDHQRIILIQTKKEDSKPITFKCSFCSFTGRRINAFALHTRTHLKNDPLYNDVRKKGKKRGPKKKTLPLVSSSIEENSVLMGKGSSLSGGEISDVEHHSEKKSRKRKRPQGASKEEDTLHKNKEQSKKPAPDITNDLLAEWDDGDDDDDESMDFELNASSKSLDDEVLEHSRKTLQAEKLLKPKEAGNGAKVNADKLDMDFTALLETTKVPDLSNLTSKSDDVKIAKIEAKSPEVATKLTNPKKRFVKSFEDFELSMKQQLEKSEKEVLKDESEIRIEDDEPLMQIEDKRSTDNRTIEEDETDAKKLDDIENSKKKSNRRVSIQGESHVGMSDDDSQKTISKNAHKFEQKKSRRASTKIEKTFLHDAGITTTLEEIDERKGSENVEVKEGKKPRRGSAMTDPVGKPDRTEMRKSCRKSEGRDLASPKENTDVATDDNKDKKQATQKDDKVCKAVDLEIDNSEKQETAALTKKSKSEVSIAKGKIDTDQEKDKKRDKTSKIDERHQKKDTKTSVSEESVDPKESATKVEKSEKVSEKTEHTTKLDKPDKSETKQRLADKTDKSKLKPKPLFEIDVFGSLRAQEKEKYNKKHDESPRRETRASRIKSHSTSAEEPKPKGTKRPRSLKSGSTDEGQINNGKNDDTTLASPLISKMKNKLMNKLAVELDSSVKKAADVQDEKVNSDDDKGVKEKKSEEIDISDEEKKKTPVNPKKSGKRADMKVGKDDPVNIKLESHKEGNNDEEKTSVPKNETESSSISKPNTRLSSGPKTYTRSSRIDKIEKAEKQLSVKSPLAPPTIADAEQTENSSISIALELKSALSDEVDQHITDENASNSVDEQLLDDPAQLEDIIGVCIAKSEEKTCLKSSSHLMKTAELVAETDLLKVAPTECTKLSESSVKEASFVENFSIEEPKKPPPSPPASQESPAKENAPISTPFKTTKSFLKSPKTSQKAPLSPSKAPTSGPSSPVKTVLTTSKSSKKSPVASPVKQPTSPIKQSKTNPIILNRDAAKFDPASSPKRALKQQSNEELASTTLNIAYESKVSNVKSPKKISLSAQEVSITEMMQAVSENKNEGDADTSVIASKVDVLNAANVLGEVEKEEQKSENTIMQQGAEASDSLDLLASGSVLNKDVTVVPENILADGQVELAKIIEDGTEKMTSFPKVVVEKDATDKTKDEQLDANLSQDIDNYPPELSQKPIILNSCLAAGSSSSTSDQESTSKLLDILTDNRRSTRTLAASTNVQQVSLPKIATPKFEIEAKKQTTHASPTKQAGRILASPTASTKSKPTILSDTLIKPADAVVSVQKVKRTYDDVEDIDTFIITKHAKTTVKTDEQEKKPTGIVQSAAKSKPKILEHTIITASGQVLQPIAKVKKPTIQQQTHKTPSSSTKTVEEKVYDLLNSPKSKEDDTFDIDSMPIVLGDQLLTNDNIEAVVSERTTQKILPITQKTTAPQQPIKKIIKQIKPFTKQMVPVTKTYTKVIKGDKLYQTTSTTATSPVVKHQPTILASGKQGKFVIVPSQSNAPPGTKYTVGKRQFVKKQPAILAQKKPAPAQASSSTEPTGGKIMIATDDQGQQKRVLVSTTDQKRMRYQTPARKGIVKASPQMLPKDRNLVGITPGSGLIAVRKPKLEPGKSIATTPTQGAPKKFLFQGSLPPLKGPPGQTRTVIIKNQQGEIVNRIHGTSDEDIEKQVAEQLEAINRASKKQLGGTTKRVVKKTIPAMGGTAITAVADTTRGALQHKGIHLPTATSTGVSRSVVPPLSPLTPARKPDIPQLPHGKHVIKQKPPSQVQRVQAASAIKGEARVPDKKEERSPKQLVIQDAMGNETTIMEGQILALPSETVDGQPQSYMLVTLDENGTLTPLNNEALMSLDPNLNLGGDLSNMVLQIEGSGGTTTTDAATTTEGSKKKVTPLKQPELLKGCQPMIGENQVIANDSLLNADISEQTSELALVPELAEANSQIQQENQLQRQELITDLAGLQSDADAPTEQIQAITCNINKGDSQQNLIITGDPVATQKFLESLTEGNPEITNLLAHVEGQNILIHTDGQQIFINSDVDNQMLMSLNQQEESTEESLVALHASQASSSKNQDILAAALADTDVFQQEQTVAATKLSQAQLSPGYPLAANNVLETSTVNSPIMTPLEAPKIGCTKIKESEVLTQHVPKNVDLPITITDPNIAQSVSTINPINHQVLMPSVDLSGIDLPLSMPDVQDVQAASTSIGIGSPGLYSLPALVDGGESPISMPLLTGDPEEVNSAEINEKLQGNGKSCATTAVVSSEETITKTAPDAKQYSASSDAEGTAEYLLATGDMCMSSLSEPPPDMFDFPVDRSFQATGTQEERESEDLLMDKSPKRGSDTVAEGENDGVEDRKRAKLD